MQMAGFLCWQTEKRDRPGPFFFLVMTTYEVPSADLDGLDSLVTNIFLDYRFRYLSMVHFINMQNWRMYTNTLRVVAVDHNCKLLCAEHS